MLHAALFTVRNGCVLAENEHKKENRVVHARVASKLVKNSVTVIFADIKRASQKTKNLTTSFSARLLVSLRMIPTACAPCGRRSSASACLAPYKEVTPVP